MNNPSVVSAIGSQGRLVVVDVLRGFALLGVLLVNLPIAALPMDVAMIPADGAASPLGDLVPWAIVKGLGETKFVSLFSLLFGIGFVLQLRRAEASGASTRFYVRRLLALGAIGLLHGFLLWFGDILFPYAVAGFVLYALRGQALRTLVTLAVLLLLVGLSLSLTMAWLDDGSAFGDQRGALTSWSGTDDTWAELERRAWTEGPLWMTFSVRAIEYGGWLAMSTLISFNWHVMALFLVGAAVARRGLLGAGYRPQHARLARWGVGIGVLVETLAIGLSLATDFAPGRANVAATLLHEVGSLVLAAGYLGAVVSVVHAGRLRSLHGPFAAVGRTALTSYLGQSVAFNLLLPWYGLGLWGALDRNALLALGVGIYLVQMALATLWLERFRMGPCEWMWRWVTYGRRPELRRS